MDKFIKLVKTAMVEKGRDDFVNYLAEILGISKQWASQKLNGRAGFLDREIVALNEEFDFDPLKLKTALESEACDEGH